MCVCVDKKKEGKAEYKFPKQYRSIAVASYEYYDGWLRLFKVVILRRCTRTHLKTVFYYC